MIVPRWLSTTSLHVDALINTLQYLKSAIVICHSQGGEIALKAAQQKPELFAGLIAIEPSAYPSSIENTPSIPTVIFAGDYLETSADWSARKLQWYNWVNLCIEQGEKASMVSSGEHCAKGHSHFPMLDQKSDAVLEKCVASLSNE